MLPKTLDYVNLNLKVGSRFPEPAGGEMNIGRPAARALKLSLLLATALAGIPAVRAAGLVETTIAGDNGSVLASDSLTAAIYTGTHDTTIWTPGGSMVFSGVTPTGISADGSAVLGVNTQNIAVWISGGTVHTLGVVQLQGAPDPDVKSIAKGLSSDGSVVVGYSTDGSPDQFQHAFVWTQSGGLVALPMLSDMSTANGVSADGTIIVGGSHYGSDSYITPIRWTIDGSGGVATLHILDPGIVGEALGISADGSAITGVVYAGADQMKHVFRWTDSDPVVRDLTPTLAAHFDAIPNGITSDGSVIIGNTMQRSYYGDANRAFRWTEATGTVDLGNLAAFPNTSTYAAAMSADGSVVVGTSSDGNDQTSHAFRWTEARGMVSIDDLLTGAGVDLGGHSLAAATGVSADGKTVVGDAATSSGDVFYIADLDGVDAASGGGSTPAVITSDVIEASFASLGAPPAGNSDHLGALFDDAGQFGPPRTSGPSAFASGGFDTDPAKSGSLGVTAPLGSDFELGAVVDAGRLTADLSYGGVSDFWAGSASAFLARNSNTGVQLFLGVGGDLFTGTITRGYLNGTTQVSSVGDTGGYGLAANGQLGWRFGNGSEGASLMPFVSATYARTHIRGYSERGGPFPATLEAIDSSSTLVRAGLEARLANGGGLAVSGRLAAVHSVVATGPVTGTLAGLLALNGLASTSATDWLETGAGLNLPMGPRTDASLGVLARFPVHGSRSFADQAGVRVSF